MVALLQSSTIRPSALAALALAPLLAAGCVCEQATHRQVTQVAAPHESGHALKVTARNGSVLVRKAGTADGQVNINAEVRTVTPERLGQTTIVANRNAEGTLEISATPPPDGWRGSEGCSFDITVPDASGVEVRTSNGKIRIEDLSGRSRLDASNGSITIVNHSGDVEAETSNGRIEADGVAGAVDASTSNGSVSIDLADSGTGPVKVNTSNGAVSLCLPAAYRGTLDISTSNGSIRLPGSIPRGAMRYMTQNNGRSAKMTIGDGGAESRVRTSNGSVKVRFGGS